MTNISKHAGWYALIAGLVVALALLGFLQYHSSRQLSDATSDQMRMNLQASLMNLRRGVENELASICRGLRPNPRNGDADELTQVAASFREWHSFASHPDLVADVLVWIPNKKDGAQLWRLDKAQSKFEGAEWPADLAGLREQLGKMSTENREDIAGRSKPADSPPPPTDMRRMGFPWLIDEHIPTLIQGRINPTLHAPDAHRAREESPPITWLIVRLDRTVLREVIAELAERYFSGRNGFIYRVAVLGPGEDSTVIYSSDDKFGSDTKSKPDASLNMFGPSFALGARAASPGSQAIFGPQETEGRRETTRGFGEQTRRPGRHEERRATVAALSTPGGEPGAGPFRLEVLRYGKRGDWIIIAEHREGSLEAAVAAIFYRNLIINFGVLSVLAITASLIVITSSRARQLAQLQVDFVAGVSHELRTPLTGIVSAAQNLSDGVVDGKDQMARYGLAILGQARQLSDLIEQILLFSAVEKGGYRYHLQHAHIAEMIEASLSNTEAMIRDGGVLVEKAIDPNLPEVDVDPKALVQCLQNLITNAVKYRGDRRWLRIRAALENNGPGKNMVSVSVEDHGIGIATQDLSRIFQPFFRSESVAASQIHGSGLGLPLTKKMVEAMGGSLSVESTLGTGSSFTIHLPIADGVDNGISAASEIGREENRLPTAD
jgi:signal transduction histidine kinase